MNTEAATGDDVIPREYQNRELSCVLTTEEMATRSSELVKREMAIAQLEAEKKAATAEINGKLKTLQKDKADLVRALHTGKEVRDIQCQKRMIFSKNLVEWVRLDTGGVIQSYAMSSIDRQLAMDELGKPAADEPGNEQTVEETAPEPAQSGNVIPIGKKRGGKRKRKGELRAVDEEPIDPREQEVSDLSARMAESLAPDVAAMSEAERKRYTEIWGETPDGEPVSIETDEDAAQRAQLEQQALEDAEQDAGAPEEE